MTAMRLVNKIAVCDVQGVELTLFEFVGRRWGRTFRRFKLCTGEAVECGEDGFIVLTTGEKLIEGAYVEREP